MEQKGRPVVISPPRQTDSQELLRYLDLYPSFLAWFENNKTVDPRFNCWIWEGDSNSQDYGVVIVACERWYVHRLAHEIWVGPTGAIKVDHICRNHSCFNPRHLSSLGDDRFASMQCVHGEIDASRCKVCARQKKMRAQRRAARTRLKRLSES